MERSTRGVDLVDPDDREDVLTSVLRDHCAVVHGDVAVTVGLSLRGEIDAAALDRIRELFAALTGAPSPITVDLEQARCRSGLLLAELVELRERRGRIGLCTTFQGLHPGVIPDLEAAELPEVFVAYRESRDRPTPDSRRSPGARCR